MDSSFRKDIEDYYKFWWENPADIRNCVFNRLNDVVTQRLPSGIDSLALDLGSGRGRIISYLINRGCKVTGIEINNSFCKELINKFPDAEIINNDVIEALAFLQNKSFEVATCIELAQNLDHSQFKKLLKLLRPITKKVLINISNKNSLHGWWSNFRKMRASFVFEYSPQDLKNYLEEAGFKITCKKGIGFITPISLFSGFKCVIIPPWVSKITFFLDNIFPNKCHLYYVEAE